MTTLLQDHHCGAIVGDHGTGKTTLLRDVTETLSSSLGDATTILLSRDPSQSWWRRLWQRHFNARTVLSHVQTCQKKRPDPFIIAVDGAEQLSWVANRRLRRWARRTGHFVLVTSHCPLRGYVTLFQTEVNPQMISHLLNQLSKRTDALGQRRIRQIMLNHDLDTVVNLRDFWFDLYDEYAKLGSQPLSTTPAESHT
ncbi:MAG: hypothetical protein AAF745_10170 [Planctomycetota bacterium]